MERTLIQKAGRYKKEIMLKDKSIYVKDKQPMKSHEYTIHYDQLGYEQVKETNADGKYVPYISGVLSILSLAGFVYCLVSREKSWQTGVISAVILVLMMGRIFLLSIKEGTRHYTYLTGGEKNLELFSNIPDHESVDIFIEEIYKIKRANALNGYKKILPASIPYEVHMEWLDHLENIKAISATEKQEFLDKLKRFDNPIGFYSSNN